MKRNGYRNLFIGIETPIQLKNGKTVKPINFDNGATTPPINLAIKELMENIPTYGPIARGAGVKGDLCTKKYGESRNSVLKFFNLEGDARYTVVYTKSTTESLNILANVLTQDSNEKVLTTRMEHHANDLPWRYNTNVEYVEVDELGRVRIEEIERKLMKNKGKIKYVSITGASNVTGYINPIHDIARICHKYNAKIIVDAAQLVAHKKVDMKGNAPEEQIDFLVFSGHKAYAPFGGGAIVGLREDLSSEEPFLKGGGCVKLVGDDEAVWSKAPERAEAGTPNFLGIMAMVGALEELSSIGFDNIYNHEMEIKNYLIDELKKIKGIKLYGDSKYTEDRLGVIVFNLKNVSYNKLAYILANEFGISTRFGKFCAHPYINRLMGVSDNEAYIHSMSNSKLEQYGMVRVSLGLYNTLDEARIFINAMKIIASNFNE